MIRTTRHKMGLKILLILLKSKVIASMKIKSLKGKNVLFCGPEINFNTSLTMTGFIELSAEINGLIKFAIC